MLTHEEREIALKQMQDLSDLFYSKVTHINVHPFIEFTGLMNEFIDACRNAHLKGVDFSECNKHAGNHLPLEEHQIHYLNEKLECIFTGRSVMSENDPTLNIVIPEGWARVKSSIVAGDKSLVCVNDSVLRFEVITPSIIKVNGTDVDNYMCPIRKKEKE